MERSERNGNKRTAMPWVADVIDDLREAFGRAEVDEVLRRGLNADCAPEHRCWFREGGQEIGKPFVDARPAISVDRMLVGEWEPVAMAGNHRGRW